MTERHRKPAISAINVAKLALAGAIIGGGTLALAGQASAARSGEWDQLAHFASPQARALDVPLAPAPDDPPAPPAPPGPPPPGTGPAAVGAPPVPEVPLDQQVQAPGQLGYLRQIWHEFHDHPDDVIGGVTPGDDPDAPPGAPTGSPQVLPPGTPPLPPGEQPLPPELQPHPLHTGQPTS